MRKMYYLAGRDRDSLFRRALRTCVLFLISAAVLLLETFLFPVLRKDLLWLILANNITTIAALISLSCFLGMWFELYSKLFSVSDNMKSYKFLTVLAAFFSVLKSVVSSVLAIKYLAEGNKVGVYYGVETVAWIALALFFVVYSRKLVSDSHFLIKDVHNDLS